MPSPVQGSSRPRQAPPSSLIWLLHAAPDSIGQPQTVPGMSRHTQSSSGIIQLSLGQASSVQLSPVQSAPNPAQRSPSQLSGGLQLEGYPFLKITILIPVEMRRLNLDFLSFHGLFRASCATGRPHLEDQTLGNSGRPRHDQASQAPSNPTQPRPDQLSAAQPNVALSPAQPNSSQPSGGLQLEHYLLLRITISIPVKMKG